MNEQQQIEVNWTSSRELHPKYRVEFNDSNDNQHQSVMEAYTSLVGEKKIGVNIAMQILTKIIVCVARQIPEIKAIFLASVGKTFMFTQKDPDFLPQFPGYEWPTWGLIDHEGKKAGRNVYGQVLNQVRNQIINDARREELSRSQGPVPQGCQPCLRCGGEGQLAGSGHYWVDDGSTKGPGRVGACFDCLPKGENKRGLGYITRAKARHNWTYATHNRNRWDDNHHGIEANLYNPDDNAMWTFVPTCAKCGRGPGEGTMLFVGRNGQPTLCKTCSFTEEAQKIEANTIMVSDVEMPF
jgi:hypothetical protein